MSNENRALHPSVMWAQRKNQLILTVCVEDCKDPQIKLEPNQIYFKGVGGTDRKPYEVTVDLYSEIDPVNSKYFVRDRSIEFFLRKKEEGPYWPRLLQDKAKVHWVKIDFNRWRDEDDSEPEDAEEQDLDEMMRKMGGLSSGSDRMDLGDLGGSDEDEDDDDVPDLE